MATADIGKSMKALAGDANAFLEGSRNNDIVNWFVLDRLAHMAETDNVTQLGRWLKFRTGCLTHWQRNALDVWDESEVDKLNTLWDYYGISSEDVLRRVLLDAPYIVYE